MVPCDLLLWFVFVFLSWSYHNQTQYSRRGHAIDLCNNLRITFQVISHEASLSCILVLQQTDLKFIELSAGT